MASAPLFARFPMTQPTLLTPLPSPMGTRATTNPNLLARISATLQFSLSPTPLICPTQVSIRVPACPRRSGCHLRPQRVRGRNRFML